MRAVASAGFCSRRSRMCHLRESWGWKPKWGGPRPRQGTVRPWGWTAGHAAESQCVWGRAERWRVGEQERGLKGRFCVI